MRYLIFIFLHFLCVGYAFSDSDNKIDMSKTFLSLLGVNSNSLSMVSVEQVITNKAPSKAQNKDCDIATYKIFGSALNEFNVLQKRYAMVKVYNGESLSSDTIAASKDFLLSIVCSYPNEQVKSMAYVSLGVVFYEDSDVALFLLGKFLDENISKEKKGLALEALSYCFEGKNDIIADIAFKTCLRSSDEELRGYVATILVENNLCKQRFLPDLISAFLTADPKSDFSKKLSKALFLYDTKLLNKYHLILRKAIECDPENNLLIDLYNKARGINNHD